MSDNYAILTDRNKAIADSFIDFLAARQEKHEKELLDAIQECEKGITNLLNAIQAGILTASTKERLEQLEMQRDELKSSILLAQIVRPKYSREALICPAAHCHSPSSCIG